MQVSMGIAALQFSGNSNVLMCAVDGINKNVQFSHVTESNKYIMYDCTGHLTAYVKKLNSTKELACGDPKRLLVCPDWKMSRLKYKQQSIGNQIILDFVVIQQVHSLPPKQKLLNGQAKWQGL